MKVRLATEDLEVVANISRISEKGDGVHRIIRPGELRRYGDRHSACTEIEASGENCNVFVFIERGVQHNRGTIRDVLGGIGIVPSDIVCFASLPYSLGIGCENGGNIHVFDLTGQDSGTLDEGKERESGGGKECRETHVQNRVERRDWRKRDSLG